MHELMFSKSIISFSSRIMVVRYHFLHISILFTYRMTSYHLLIIIITRLAFIIPISFYDPFTNIRTLSPLLPNLSPLYFSARMSYFRPFSHRQHLISRGVGNLQYTHACGVIVLLDFIGQYDIP